MAKSRKQSKTGFRNGLLFCFNCGQSYKMNLPAPIDMAAAMMKQFDKTHKNCPKTWEEPKPDPDMTDSHVAMAKNAIWWWNFGERGMSSECMYNYLMSGSADGNHPHDPDDFKRCYALLECVPQWKSQLYKMKEVSPTWSALVDNWDKLSTMLEEQLAGKKNDMFQFMQSLGC